MFCVQGEESQSTDGWTRKLQLASSDCNSHEMMQRNLSGKRYQDYQNQQKHYFIFEDEKIRKDRVIYVINTEKMKIKLEQN